MCIMCIVYLFPLLSTNNLFQKEPKILILAEDNQCVTLKGNDSFRSFHHSLRSVLFDLGQKINRFLCLKGFQSAILVSTFVYHMKLTEVNKSSQYRLQCISGAFNHENKSYQLLKTLLMSDLTSKKLFVPITSLFIDEGLLQNIVFAAMLLEHEMIRFVFFGKFFFRRKSFYD